MPACALAAGAGVCCKEEASTAMEGALYRGGAGPGRPGLCTPGIEKGELVAGASGASADYKVRFEEWRSHAGRGAGGLSARPPCGTGLHPGVGSAAPCAAGRWTRPLAAAGWPQGSGWSLRAMHWPRACAEGWRRPAASGRARRPSACPTPQRGRDWGSPGPSSAQGAVSGVGRGCSLQGGSPRCVRGWREGRGGKGSQASCKLLLTKIPFKRQRLVPLQRPAPQQSGCAAAPAPRGSRGLAHSTRR